MSSNVKAPPAPVRPRAHRVYDPFDLLSPGWYYKFVDYQQRPHYF